MAETFAERLKQLREAAGLSRYQLAKDSGLSAQALLYLEAGTVEPKLTTVQTLAQALHVGPWDLIPGFATRPLPAADVRTIDDVRREAGRRYKVKVEPTLKRLADLAGCDRSTFAPDVLAHCAEILMKEIPALFRLLSAAAKEPAQEAADGPTDGPAPDEGAKPRKRAQRPAKGPRGASNGQASSKRQTR